MFIILKVIYDIFQAIYDLFEAVVTTLMARGHSHYISKAGTEQLCK